MQSIERLDQRREAARRIVDRFREEANGSFCRYEVTRLRGEMADQNQPDIESPQCFDEAWNVLVVLRADLQHDGPRLIERPGRWPVVS